MKKASILVLFVLGVGCQKEIYWPVKTPSLFGRWKFVSFKEGPLFLSDANPCFADNTLNLRSDSVAILDQGPCLTPGEPREENLGKWTATATTLTLKGNANKIFKLDDSTLWFGQDSGPEVYQYRWKK